MDRLAAYAVREAVAQSPEDRQKAEVVATTKLMERLKLPKEEKVTSGMAANFNDHGEESANGEGSSSGKTKVKHIDDVEPSKTNGESSGGGIPSDVKLFVIFHEQVINLVSAQRLSIQDTTALLVSLANLALYVFPFEPRPECRD